MRLSAMGAQKTRSDSKKLRMYSKQWAPGDTLRVYYPIFWENNQPQIAVGAIWGHNVSDIKGLGLKTAFIPSTMEFTESGDPIGSPDITYQFSMIAPAILRGEHARREASIMKKSYPTEAARREALSSLDAEYGQNGKQPIISRARYFISTEVLSIKLVNGVPDKETIGISAAPLSDQTITKLYSLMNDSKYRPNPDDTFFEVEWKYPVNPDKGEAGRAATCSGITPEYRLQVTCPSEYALLQGFFDNIMTDSDSITRRATRMVDPVRVKNALVQYSFLHSEDIDAVSDDDTSILCNNADLLKELDISRALVNTDLKSKILQAISDIEATEPAAPVIPELTAPAAPAPEAPLPDLSNVTGAPTLDNLLANPMRSDMDEAEFQNVDLSMG